MLNLFIICSPLATAGPQADASEVAENDVGVVARIHFNTQTRDFDRARAFYRLLGYTQGVGNFPKTNTHLMARSLGMDELCTYELESIEVISIPNGQGSTSIDLIKFAVPFNDEPPYALPNHLGIAYAALGTTTFARDYRYLKQQGVTFLSEPFGEPGEQFVFMRDPDGVYLKLTEVASTSNPSTDAAATINIQTMPYIGINVSDFNAALDFYKSLGYTNTGMLPANGSLAEARAYGLGQPFMIRGADLKLIGGDGNTLRIIQWLEPFDADPPYPPPISHIGIHRVALAVRDLDVAVRSLTRQGVRFLSEIAPCCSGTGQDETGIINAVDPDGAFVELVGPIRRRPLEPTAEICTGQELEKATEQTFVITPDTSE